MSRGRLDVSIVLTRHLSRYWVLMSDGGQTRGEKVDTRTASTSSIFCKSIVLTLYAGHPLLPLGLDTDLCCDAH